MVKNGSRETPYTTRLTNTRLCVPDGVNSVPSPTGSLGSKSGGRLSIAPVRSSDSGRGPKPRGGRRHGAQGGIGENPETKTLVTLLPGSAGCQQQATPGTPGSRCALTTECRLSRQSIDHQPPMKSRKMYANRKRECANCAFFQRYTKEMVEEKVVAVTSATDLTPAENEIDFQSMMEFGKCVRYPPQFFYETLNGEWPVVHQTHFCGEYRADDRDPHWN